MTTRRRFLAGAGATVGLGVGVAGCGYRPGGGDPRWREDSVSGLSSESAVGVADGYLYGVAETARGIDFDSHEWVTGSSVVAYDTDDGSEYADLDFDAEMSAHAVGESGLAVAFEPESEGETQGTVARVTADGVQWRAPVDGSVVELATADGRAYALTAAGGLVACADGSRAWTADLSGEREPTTETDRGPRPLVVAAGADAVVAAAGEVLAGFAPNGERRWVRRDVGSLDSGVVRGDRAVAWNRRDLIALNAVTGATRWTQSAETETVTLTSDGGYRSDEGALVAFDPAGERRWSAAGDAVQYGGYYGPVAVDADGVYARWDESLVAHDPSDGRVRWSVEYDRISAGPFVTDSGVLVVADGGLVCHYATDRF